MGPERRGLHKRAVEFSSCHKQPWILSSTVPEPMYYVPRYFNVLARICFAIDLCQYPAAESGWC